MGMGPWIKCPPGCRPLRSSFVVGGVCALGELVDEWEVYLNVFGWLVGGWLAE